MTHLIINCVSPFCKQAVEGFLDKKKYTLAIHQLFTGLKEKLSRESAHPQTAKDLLPSLGHREKWSDLSKLDKSLCVIFMILLHKNNTSLTERKALEFQEAMDEISDDESGLAQALKNCVNLA